ncbi:hypothetical protein H4R33_005597 [Dimargaris cristalligena]|uniref:G-protein coupled receptors family 3 profile domain-containing protein n=1 Tax=Dimargaris cristalligena TaxID=215637 RepID=A0A4P9ZS19_9FUNG|nr:hypothetical protein H4R33_005597 [Dimargaris cristalligena]RKP36356.1 hypothetical protein BJ085DRAFT_38976 [Dimargaris cristalligena]|eukprot:RKP36356.1 hypothetical protein BJ085DRAFT_38976 [Dimargaris cristalligena]
MESLVTPTIRAPDMLPTSLVGPTSSDGDHQILAAESPIALHAKLIVGGVLIGGLLFTIYINTVFTLRKKALFYYANLGQAVAALASVLTVTLINQEVFSDACTVLLFLATFGMSICISLCQYVLLLRLHTLVHNRKLLWFTSAVIALHSVYFVVVSMLKQPSIVGRALCIIHTQQSLLIVYVVVSLGTEVYLTGHFIWQLVAHIRCINGLQREIEVSKYRRLIDIGGYITLINTVVGVALWACALEPHLSQFYFTVLALMVATPSFTTTFMCWSIYTSGYQHTHARHIPTITGVRSKFNPMTLQSQTQTQGDPFTLSRAIPSHLVHDPQPVHYTSSASYSYDYTHYPDLKDGGGSVSGREGRVSFSSTADQTAGSITQLPGANLSNEPLPTWAFTTNSPRTLPGPALAPSRVLPHASFGSPITTPISSSPLESAPPPRVSHDGPANPRRSPIMRMSSERGPSQPMTRPAPMLPGSYSDYNPYPEIDGPRQ